MKKVKNTPISFNKPEEIFAQAEVFYLVSKLAHKESVKQSMVTNPNIGIQVSFSANVNHAFAFELYLKCLQVLEGNAYYSGHNLKDLFYKLKPESQIRIINRSFCVIKSFDEVISEASEAFVEIRYIGKNFGTYLMTYLGH